MTLQYKNIAPYYPHQRLPRRVVAETLQRSFALPCRLELNSTHHSLKRVTCELLMDNTHHGSPRWPSMVGVYLNVHYAHLCLRAWSSSLVCLSDFVPLPFINSSFPFLDNAQDNMVIHHRHSMITACLQYIFFEILRIHISLFGSGGRAV